jgi:hypothetical protein
MLADMNGDGKMDKKEFSMAMHLIKKKLQGYELPKVLPPALKADPNPTAAAYNMAAPGGPRPMGGVNMGMGECTTGCTRLGECLHQAVPVPWRE